MQIIAFNIIHFVGMVATIKWGTEGLSFVARKAFDKFYPMK